MCLFTHYFTLVDFVVRTMLLAFDLLTVNGFGIAYCSSLAL